MSIDPCEVRPCKDKRGVDLISDALPFGRLCYGGPNAASNAVSYAMHYSRSHNKVIRVYDESGNVIETHEHTGDFKEPWCTCALPKRFRFLNAERFGTILALEPFKGFPRR